MHSLWSAVLSTVYTRMVLMPSFLNFAMSRLQPVTSAMGSFASEAPPTHCYWALWTVLGMIVPGW